MALGNQGPSLFCLGVSSFELRYNFLLGRDNDKINSIRLSWVWQSTLTFFFYARYLLKTPGIQDVLIHPFLIYLQFSLQLGTIQISSYAKFLFEPLGPSHFASKVWHVLFVLNLEVQMQFPFSFERTFSISIA